MLTTSIFCELVCRWAKYCKDEINNTIPYYSVVKDILFFINNNIQLNFSIHSLAEKCFLSERQFREVFRQFTGVSPKQYICQQKLKRIAMTLITTPVTINALAADFNYSSPFQLSRDFKKYFGVSPKEYRNTTRLDFSKLFFGRTENIKERLPRKFRKPFFCDGQQKLKTIKGNTLWILPFLYRKNFITIDRKISS